MIAQTALHLANRTRERYQTRSKDGSKVVLQVYEEIAKTAI